MGFVVTSNITLQPAVILWSAGCRDCTEPLLTFETRAVCTVKGCLSEKIETPQPNRQIACDLHHYPTDRLLVVY